MDTSLAAREVREARTAGGGGRAVGGDDDDEKVADEIEPLVESEA